MPVKKDNFSLQKPTQVNRTHPREIGVPGLYRARNMYVEKGDMALRLRPDINVLTTPTVYDILADFATTGITAAQKHNYLNSIAISQKSDNRAFMTRLCPVYENSTINLSSQYTTGTITTDGVTSRVIGSGTMFLYFLWKHCFIKISTKWYRVTSVDSNTQLYVDGTPPAVTGATVDIIRPHDGERADFPLHIEPYVNSVIYNATSPVKHTDDGAICGPFRSDLERTDSAWDTVQIQTETQATLAAGALYGVCLDWVGAYLYVAVGKSGTIVTSEDGVTLALQVSGTSSNLHSVACGYVNGVATAVAVGRDGTVVYSTDCVNWTVVDTGNEWYLGVAYSESLNLWCAVGQTEYASGKCLVSTSPDGITWTHRVEGPIWTEQIGTTGGHCGCQDIVSTIQVQTGGINCPGLYDVVADTGVGFVAVGMAGTIITSPDGINWTQVACQWIDHRFISSFDNILFYSVDYDSTATVKYVAAGVKTYNRRTFGTRMIDDDYSVGCVYSSTTQTWTEQDFSSSIDIRAAIKDIMWNENPAGERVVGVGHTMNKDTGINWKASAATLATWTRGTWPSKWHNANAMCQNAGYIYAVGSDWGEFYAKNWISTDYGATFIEPVINSAFTLTSVTKTLATTIVSGGRAPGSGGKFYRSLALPLFYDIYVASTANHPGTVDTQYVTWNAAAYVIGLSYGGRYASYSTDEAATWTMGDPWDPTDETTNNSIATDGTSLIVGGTAGATSTQLFVWKSADGASWTKFVVDATPTGDINRIRWCGTMYVAVGTNGCIYTSADGETWTERTSGESDDLTGIAWDGTNMLTVGYNGACRQSTDGVTWNDKTPSAGDWNNVIWDGTYFMIVGAASKIEYTANAGTSFTAKTCPLDAAINITGVALSKLTWVFCGNKSGEEWIFGTDDFTTYTRYYISSDPKHFCDIAATGANCLAVGEDGLMVTLSDTGAATKVADAPFATFYGCCWDATNSQWVAVGASGAIYTSADAVTWTNQTSAMTDPFYSVSYGPGVLIAVGVGGVVYTSPDGITWTSRTSGVAQDLNKTRCINSKYFAVGGNGTIITSTDPTGTWTTRTSGTTQSLNDAAYGNSLYVVVGENGTILKSADMATWTAVNAGVGENITGVIYTSTEFWAVTSTGKLYTSTDADTWSILQNATTSMILAVAWTGTSIIAVGANGNIIRKTSSLPLNKFEPLSEDYRASAFAVVDGYVVLFGTYEWNSELTRWEWNKRRIRWTAPGTFNDFETEEQAGFADCFGEGDFCDARTVGHAVIVWETNRICILSQTGVTEAPWEYRAIHEKNRILSNPLVVNDVAYWVASDGMLYACNGQTVEPLASPFDLSLYNDSTDYYPVWLVHDDTSGSIVIMLQQSSGDTLIYFYQADLQCLTETLLPTLDTGESPRLLLPQSIVSSRGGWSLPTLMVGYENYTSDTDRLIVAKFNYDGVIKGTDAIISDRHWFAELWTGFQRLVPRGLKTSIKLVTIDTYADGTDTPRLVIMARGSDESGWSDGSDDLGTISVTASTCVGTGTVWSNIFGIGTGAVSAYTFPVLYAKCTLAANNGVDPIAVPAHTAAAMGLTFAAPLTLNYQILGYWTGEPEIQNAIGDFIYTTSGFHNVTAITDTYHCTLGWYPATTLSGTHYKGYATDIGEGEVFAGLHAIVDALQLRIVVIPQDSASASTNFKILSFLVNHVPSEDRQEKS